MKRFLYIWSLCFVCTLFVPHDKAEAQSDAQTPSNTQSHPFVSSKEIPVGSPDKCGPLCAPYSTDTDPVGWAYVFKSQRPDIFVAGKNWHEGTEQGLYLYRFVSQDSNGAPTFKYFKNVKVKPFKGKKLPPAAEIYQDKTSGRIYGMWYYKQELINCLFDVNACEFYEIQRIKIKGIKADADDTATPLKEIESNVSGLTVIPHKDGTAEIAIGLSNGVKFMPNIKAGDKNNPRSDKWQPYDGAGRWRGGWPYVGIYSARTSFSLLQNIKFDLNNKKTSSQILDNFKLISENVNEILLNCYKISRVNLGQTENDIICGSRFGGIYYFRQAEANSGKLKKKLHITGQDGIALRHPAMSPRPMGYPNSQGLSDIIAGGQCALYYYRFTGKFTPAGNPIYEEPQSVLEKNAKLHLGSLVSPDTGDFDGDGLIDIIAGSSEGYVYFCRNLGTADKPRFSRGEPLFAEGKKIHIQQNYMSIQGPQEIRWGYVGPTIADWNEDGLPDILLSSANSENLVFLNIGKKGEPKLAAGQKLYCNDLNLYGTWRVKPGVAKIGGRMAYIILDEDDQFHLYWKIDNFNLEDGGKLKMANGKYIDCNGEFGGGRGRAKIDLADWDRDGIIDMFVGTARGGSIPDSNNGLPNSRKYLEGRSKGIQVMYLRNIGSNEKPVFENVKQMQFRGQDLPFGAHESSPAVVDFKNPNGLDILVGVEYGNIIYFAHEDVTFKSLEELTAPANTVLRKNKN